MERSPFPFSSRSGCAEKMKPGVFLTAQEGKSISDPQNFTTETLISRGQSANLVYFDTLYLQTNLMWIVDPIYARKITVHS